MGTWNSCFRERRLSVSHSLSPPFPSLTCTLPFPLPFTSSLHLLPTPFPFISFFLSPSPSLSPLSPLPSPLSPSPLYPSPSPPLSLVLPDGALPSLLPRRPLLSQVIHFELPKNRTCFTNRLALLYSAMHRWSGVWSGVWWSMVEWSIGKNSIPCFVLYTYIPFHIPLCLLHTIC